MHTFLKMIYFFSILIAFESSCFAKFQRALVLTGNNINTALFLGILEGVEADKDHPIDVTIGGCGGAIATAIANVLPNAIERRRLIESEEFYQLLKSLSINDITWPKFLWELGQVHYRAWNNQLSPSNPIRQVPPLFDFYLLNLQNEFNHLPFLNVPFSPKNSGIRTVIIASRAEFTKTDVGKPVWPNQKLFSEVYFTDYETAKELRMLDPKTQEILDGPPSYVGHHFPDSAFYEKPRVITNFLVSDAVKASTADPHLMAPAEIEGNYYTTGAINIDPINIARQLAKEVIVRDPSDFDTFLEVPTFYSVYGFNPNQLKADVRKDMKNDKGTKYIKLDYSSETYPKMSPGPKGHLHWNPGRTIQFGMGVPNTYREYLKLVEEQYFFGFRKGLEAVQKF